MTSAWSTVPLGEVVKYRKEFITIDDLKIYRRPRVQLHAQGIVLRDALPGALIKTKKQQVARAGEFLVAEIDAKVGGFGIVPDDLDGSVVSSHYFLFGHNPDRIDNKFLAWFIKTPTFRQQVEAQGSTNYAAIRPADVLGYEVPLPPLGEQRRIVARIEQLAAKVEEAKGLKRDIADEVGNLVGKRIAEIFALQNGDSWSLGTLGDYVVHDCYGTSEKTTDDVAGTPILRMGNIQDGRLIPRPLKYLHVPPKDRGKLVLQKGDILVNRTNSAELVGKCAVFDLDGEYGFASYIIRLRLDGTRANSNLVAAYINSPIGRAYMFDEKKQMTGQANVNATTLKKLPLPLPSLDTQHCIVAELSVLQGKLDAVKSLQTETVAEIDALLPAILDKAFKGGL